MRSTIRDLALEHAFEVSPDETIDRAAELIATEGADELYVVDAQGRLMGVVPDYELLKALLLHTPGTEAVASLMSCSLLMLHPEMDVLEAAVLFRDRRCSHVAVVEEGRLVGRLGRRTILTFLLFVGQRELENMLP